VYILMLERPLGNDRHQARFYCGWAKYLDARIHHHRAGRGSSFTRAAVQQGIRIHLVWSARGTRNDERRIKNHHNLGRFLRSQGINIEEVQNRFCREGGE
jgi:putative endonuclease